MLRKNRSEFALEWPGVANEDRYPTLRAKRIDFHCVANADSQNGSRSKAVSRSRTQNIRIPSGETALLIPNDTECSGSPEPPLKSDDFQCGSL